jgi:hypothetical protein
VSLLMDPQSGSGEVVVSARGTLMQDVIGPLRLTGRLLDLAMGEGAILIYFGCFVLNSKYLLYIIIHLC